ILQGGETVELRIKDAKAVGKTGNHVEAHETVEARLAELRDLLLVVLDRIMRGDEIVCRAVSHDDLSAFGAELFETHIGDIHNRRDRCDARLILLRIELQRIEFRIAREDKLYSLIARAI